MLPYLFGFWVTINDDIQFKALIPRQGNHLIRDFIYLNYLHQERHNCTSTKCYDAFCATLANAIHNGEDRKEFQPSTLYNLHRLYRINT